MYPPPTTTTTAATVVFMTVRCSFLCSPVVISNTSELQRKVVQQAISMKILVKGTVVVYYLETPRRCLSLDWY